MDVISKWYWIVGGVVVAIAATLLALVGGEYLGRKDGIATVQVSQLAEQKKTDDTVHKNYERIDHATPYTGAKSARIKWLLDNARRSQ